MYSVNAFGNSASTRQIPLDDPRSGLVQIVGPSRIWDRPEAGDGISLASDLAPALPARYRVEPHKAGEVEAIVRWANETRTPLVPLSSGPPHLRGDSSPSVPLAVIVDLRAMNRIPKIDRRTRLVLIEPGVTFAQLQPQLEAAGLRLITPLLPRREKSVLASLLEREPGMSPRYQWNMGEPLRSLEIVWGNGDRFYSGGGAFRGVTDEDWQQGKVPLVGPGPGQLDFYKMVSAAQGTMGIVTWASVKCEVLPDARKLFLVPASRLDSLLDFTYRMLRFRFADELFIVNGACLAAVLSRGADDAEHLRKILPPWCVVVGIAGSQVLAREYVGARERDIRDIAQQFGLRLAADVPGCRSSDLLDLLGLPSAEPYWKLRHRGGCQELFFLTTLDKTPGFVETMLTAANGLQRQAADIAVYLQPVHQGVGCHCEFILPFDPQDAGDRQKAVELFREASHRLFRQKAYFSRPYGIWAGMVFNADARTTIVTQRVRRIFDPGQVMNPGKLCF
jgi:FAD/FMN-containing dehydrogenase